jgi:hypothetical protein
MEAISISLCTLDGTVGVLRVNRWDGYLDIFHRSEQPQWESLLAFIHEARGRYLDGVLALLRVIKVYPAASGLD